MAEISAQMSAMAEHDVLLRQSPSRRKLDTSIPGAPRTPLTKIMTSPRVTHSITIFDQIVQWFHSEISNRVQTAAIGVAFLSTLVFIVSTSFLMFSLWQPLSSLHESLLWWLIYPSSWISIALHGAFSFLTAIFTIKSVCKVDQDPRIPLTESFAWTIVAAHFIHSLFAINSILFITDSSLVNGFSWVPLTIGCLVSSAVIVFRNDFHLRFPEIDVSNRAPMLTYIKSLPIDQILDQTLIDAAVPCGSAVLSVIVLGPVFQGFSAWWLLFDISFYYTALVFLFGQQLFTKLSLRLINIVIMKPMKFSFPPSFVVHSPTPDQTRTLTNVLESSDPLLKVFALYDIRDVAWNDSTRRQDVWALSQPGGHARNWRAVSKACMSRLTDLCTRITTATAKLIGSSYGDHDEDDVPRDAMLMPRISREMAFGGDVARQRNIVPLRSLNTRSNTLTNRLRGKVNANNAKPVISRYDAQLDAYAAEALYMLLVCSFTEDRFGVVQKDLKDQIDLLCRLIMHIDTYIRAKNSVADKADHTYLNIVDISLKSSLERVVANFGHHIRSLKLTAESIRTIQMVCKVEDL